jgi:hypothetical protein
MTIKTLGPTEASVWEIDDLRLLCLAWLVITDLCLGVMISSMTIHSSLLCSSHLHPNTLTLCPCVTEAQRAAAGLRSKQPNSNLTPYVAIPSPLQCNLPQQSIARHMHQTDLREVRCLKPSNTSTRKQSFSVQSFNSSQQPATLPREPSM